MNGLKTKKMKKEIFIDKTETYQDLVNKSNKLFPKTPWEEREITIKCNTMNKYMHLLEIVNQEVQKQIENQDVFYGLDRELSEEKDNNNSKKLDSVKFTSVVLEKIGLINISYEPNIEEENKELKEKVNKK